METMDLAMEVKYMMTEYRLNIRVFTVYITVIIRKSAQCRKNAYSSTFVDEKSAYTMSKTRRKLDRFYQSAAFWRE